MVKYKVFAPKENLDQEYVRVEAPIFKMARGFSRVRAPGTGLLVFVTRNFWRRPTNAVEDSLSSGVRHTSGLASFHLAHGYGRNRRDSD